MEHLWTGRMEIHIEVYSISVFDYNTYFTLDFYPFILKFSKSIVFQNSEY